MDHIPIVVIGRVAVFADNDTLVLLSCCSKWLRYCVRQHNNLWYQRYKLDYNLAEGNEIKWLAWYVKTVRASKLLAPQAKKTVNTAQLNSQHIEWFYAFCYRRATDANWLKDTPYPVKDVVEKEPDNTRSIVLQRIEHYHIDPQKCFIVEQCQPIGEASNKRFWRLCRLFSDDVDYILLIKQCLISDKFVVAISEQANSANLICGKTCTISIWPVNRVSIMQPRQFSCLCDDASICGRWMMINHFEIIDRETNRFNRIITTRVFDLANGQMCMGTIKTHQGEVFLLRVTEEAATIFSISMHHSDTTNTIKWNVWEFSNRRLGYGPRCLMQGEIRFTKYRMLDFLIRKLDGNRVLIENLNQFGVQRFQQHRTNGITLAMISTECGYSNTCIEDVKPIWTHSGYIYGTVPLFGSNRILVVSKKEWTIHSITDGTILAQVNEETFSLISETYSVVNTRTDANFFSLYMGRFVLYKSKHDKTFKAIDLTHLNRIKTLGKATSNYLYEKALGRRNTIIIKLNHIIYHSLLLNDMFNTRNARVIVDNEDYKIIDMSF